MSAAPKCLRSLFWLPAGAFVLFLTLYLGMHGNLSLLWQPAIVLICLGLCWLARGIGGWAGLVPLSRAAAKDPHLRLTKALLSARAIPTALAAYALISTGILLFTNLGNPPEVLGHVAGAFLTGAIYLCFAFLLCLPRIRILEARIPAGTGPRISLAGPTGTMVAGMAFMLAFNSLFLDACFLNVVQEGTALDRFALSLPVSWDVLSLDGLAEGADRVLSDGLIPLVVMTVGILGLVLGIGGLRAFPGLRNTARAVGHSGLCAVLLFSPVLGMQAYGRLVEEYSGSVFAALILLLVLDAVAAALGRWLLRDPSSAVIREPEPGQDHDPSQAPEPRPSLRVQRRRPVHRDLARTCAGIAAETAPRPIFAPSRTTALACAFLALAVTALGLYLLNLPELFRAP